LPLVARLSLGAGSRPQASLVNGRAGAHPCGLASRDPIPDSHRSLLAPGIVPRRDWRDRRQGIGASPSIRRILARLSGNVASRPSAPRPMFLRRVRRTGRVRRHVQRTRPLVGKIVPWSGHPRSRSLGPHPARAVNRPANTLQIANGTGGLQTASPATTCPRRRLEPAACPARKSSTSPTPCPWRSHGHAVASRPQSPGLFDPVRSPVRANVQPASPRRAGVRMPSPLPTSAYVAPQAGPHNPLPVVYS